MRLPYRQLYQAARTLNTADALLNPKRLPTRLKNIALGRLLARTGAWERIWR